MAAQRPRWLSGGGHSHPSDLCFQRRDPMRFRSMEQKCRNYRWAASLAKVRRGWGVREGPEDVRTRFWHITSESLRKCVPIQWTRERVVFRPAVDRLIIGACHSHAWTCIIRVRLREKAHPDCRPSMSRRRDSTVVWHSMDAPSFHGGHRAFYISLLHVSLLRVRNAAVALRRKIRRHPHDVGPRWAWVCLDGK